MTIFGKSTQVSIQVLRLLAQQNISLYERCYLECFLGLEVWLATDEFSLIFFEWKQNQTKLPP